MTSSEEPFIHYEFFWINIQILIQCIPVKEMEEEAHVCFLSSTRTKFTTVAPQRIANMVKNGALQQTTTTGTRCGVTA